jgi:hypothetical protein
MAIQFEITFVYFIRRHAGVGERRVPGIDLLERYRAFSYGGFHLCPATWGVALIDAQNFWTTRRRLNVAFKNKQSTFPLRFL